MRKEDINRIIGITESFKLPERLMEILLDDSKKENVFDQFELTDVCVSNPPYSLKYNPKNDTRFPEFEGMLPTNFADYVFVAFGLHLSKDPVHLIYVLPHGVLFRGSKEEKFRKFLIERNLIRTVIGLPEKIFLNTGIPTLIMEIKKSDDLLFVDASKNYEKHGKLNVITDQHLNTIVSSVRLRKNIEKMAHVADIKEIKSNDYNLNIPRYVDMFEYEELPDMTDALLEMINDDMDRMSLETQVISLLEQMEGTSEEEDRKLKAAIAQAKKQIRKRVKELEII